LIYSYKTKKKYYPKSWESGSKGDHNKL